MYHRPFVALEVPKKFKIITDKSKINLFSMQWRNFWSWTIVLMITRPALCPTESTFWNKTPKSQLTINRILSSFFLRPIYLASLKAVECSMGPSSKTNISKLNFPSGRIGRTAGAASSTLVKLSLIRSIFLWMLVEHLSFAHNFNLFGV